MQLRYMSDLHFTTNPSVFKYQAVPVMENEKEQILILAGDIGENLSQFPFLVEACNRFKQVLYVFGNHEFYNGSLVHAHQKLKERFDIIPDNLHIMDGNELILDGVVFIGATLWTDFDKQRFTSMFDAQRNMHDYSKIRTGPSDCYWKYSITPEIILDKHISDLQFIKMRLSHWKQLDSTIPIVVITHHAPSTLSISEQYLNNSLNGCFASSLEDTVDGYNVKYWFHGHMHSQSDYMMYDTRVICNPRGYTYMNHTGNIIEESSVRYFNPFAVVEI